MKLPADLLGDSIERDSETYEAGLYCLMILIHESEIRKHGSCLARMYLNGKVFS